MPPSYPYLSPNQIAAMSSSAAPEHTGEPPVDKGKGKAVEPAEDMEMDDNDDSSSEEEAEAEQVSLQH